MLPLPAMPVIVYLPICSGVDINSIAPFIDCAVYRLHRLVGRV